MRAISVGLTAVISVSILACSGRSWQLARSEDSASAYSRFVREHPRSSHTREARERLAFVRVRSKPTAEGYREFRAGFPESPLLDELRSLVAEQFFLRARAAGTAAAYREFVAEFPDDARAARAEGNAEYLEHRGFGDSPSALAEFAARHPGSDYAPEASRSAAAAALRGSSAFRRVGLTVEITASTRGRERLARVFGERALRRYEAAGLELVPLRGPDDPRAKELPVRLSVRHGEAEVRTKLRADRVESPGVLATTTVTLTRAGDPEPIWSEEFAFRAGAAERREETSILFGAGAQRYWSSFFIPLATWSTQAAVRSPRTFSERVASVEAAGNRAIVLFEDGDFQIFDLGDPTAPLLVGSHQRARDLTRWSGLHLAGDSVALFGEDGLELVELGPEGPRLARALDRAAVGSIVAAETFERGLVTAGNRGLLLLEGEGGQPHALLRREILGLARLGERILFTDGVSLYVSTLPLLREQRTLAELRLGKGFRPARVRVQGATAVVLGERGVVRVDLSNPTEPRVLSRIEGAEIGAIHDATLAGGRLFLLGERGLQIADASGERVVDSADVSARQQISRTGRHLVMVGNDTLQVVDTTPFLAGSAAASAQ